MLVYCIKDGCFPTRKSGFVCSPSHSACVRFFCLLIYILIYHGLKLAGGRKGSSSTEQMLSAGIVSTLVLLRFQGKGAGINPFGCGIVGGEMGGELLIVLRGSRMWRCRSGLKSKGAITPAPRLNSLAHKSRGKRPLTPKYLQIFHGKTSCGCFSGISCIPWM